MEKLLSIVIPTYNMEKYLDKCLTSLIADDDILDLLEVLVIIDGAKDRSSEIAHFYEHRYSQAFRVIDKENGNYGSCVNKGLFESTGKYIRVLDADDYFDTANFCSFIKYLKKEESDMIISDSRSVYDDGSFHKLIYDLPSGIFNLDDINESALKSLFMHAITYKTELLKSWYKQTEGISYTDIEWAYLPTFKVNTISYFPMIIYNYNIGRPGQTVSVASRSKNMWMEVKVVKRLIDEYNMREGGNTAFATKRLALFIEQLYNYYLISFRGGLDIAQLEDFDTFLASSSEELYRQMDNCSIRRLGWRYYFIKDWREKHSLDTLRSKLFSILSKIR